MKKCYASKTWMNSRLRLSSIYVIIHVTNKIQIQIIRCGTHPYAPCTLGSNLRYSSPDKATLQENLCNAIVHCTHIGHIGLASFCYAVVDLISYHLKRDYVQLKEIVTVRRDCHLYLRTCFV